MATGSECSVFVSQYMLVGWRISSWLGLANSCRVAVKRSIQSRIEL